MTQQIVTANRLGDGRVVFLAWDGGWSETIDDAHRSDGAEESEWLLAMAGRAAAARLVVDPYLIDVAVADGRVRAVKRRERIRAAGPTVQAAPPRPALAA